MAFPVLASGTHAAPGSAGGFVERSSWLEPETMALMHLDLTTLLLSSHLRLPGEGTQRQRGTETEGTHSGAAVGPGIHPVLGGRRPHLSSRRPVLSSCVDCEQRT